MPVTIKCHGTGPDNNWIFTSMDLKVLKLKFQQTIKILVALFSLLAFHDRITEGLMETKYNYIYDFCQFE